MIGIKEIDRLNLCLGCGLCEAVCGVENVKMGLGTDGFFHPVGKEATRAQNRIINKICPGLTIDNDLTFSAEQRIWGRTETLASGHAMDPVVRSTASSGGVISGLAIGLVELGVVDAILQVGSDPGDFRTNRLVVSKTREQVLACASSRYAPSLIFNEIFHILDASPDCFAFVGKPCDISGLKNLLKSYPHYNGRIKLFVSILCAGMPSYQATEQIIDQLKASRPVRNLRYRGKGWPGRFAFVDNDEKAYSLSYHESWGGVLGKNLHPRCKLCPDGIGLQADIAVGDAWETIDGYPTFEEKAGESLIIIRTRTGGDFIELARKRGCLHIAEIGDAGRLKMMQPYQFDRRNYVGSRILAFVFRRKAIPRFRGTRIWSNLLAGNPITALRELRGALRRVW